MAGSVQSVLCVAAVAALLAAVAPGCDRPPGSAAQPTSTNGQPTDSEPPTMLIDPAELQGRLGQPQLRVLDTRAREQYLQGHVPGALHVDVRDWQQLALTDGGLHDAAAWAQRVGALGIADDCTIVVYGSSLSDSARVWWTLKYLGLRDVRLLDGGWKLWQAMSLPTQTDEVHVQAADFIPRFQPDRLEEFDTLQDAVAQRRVAVVDARSHAEFTGEEVRGARGGHIPGAKHLEWTQLLAESGRFKSPDELRALFGRCGLSPDDTAVTHCQSGGRAAVNAFALELAGYPRVKVFVRGWSQWSVEQDAPVATGPNDD
jgi:thiosulfate/3-mercaptopyruvate sulfurtransferase